MGGSPPLQPLNGVKVIAAFSISNVTLRNYPPISNQSWSRPVREKSENR